MKGNLLYELAKNAGHGKNQIANIYDVLCTLSPNEYSLEEWKEAAGYILWQKMRSFDTSDSVYWFLRYELEKATLKY